VCGVVGGMPRATCDNTLRGARRRWLFVQRRACVAGAQSTRGLPTASVAEGETENAAASDAPPRPRTTATSAVGPSRQSIFVVRGPQKTRQCFFCFFSGTLEKHRFALLSNCR